MPIINRENVEQKHNSENEVCVVLSQSFNRLITMHNLNLLHLKARSFKMESFFLRSQCEEREPYVVKIDVIFPLLSN